MLAEESFMQDKLVIPWRCPLKAHVRDDVAFLRTRGHIFELKKKLEKCRFAEAEE